MGEIGNRLRVIEGRPWRQALICALNPDAPFQRWSGVEAVELDDIVIVIIDTDPVTVLCAFTYGAMLDIRHSIVAECRFGRQSLSTAAAVEAALGFSLVDLNGLPLSAGTAKTLLRAVNGLDRSGVDARTGDSSVSVARILAASRLLCTCCHQYVVLRDEHDLYRLVHTASAEALRERRDWPALLCADCDAAMRAAGHASVVDFVFSQRPACPACGASKASTIGYGMPSFEGRVNMTPWESSGGCVVGPDSAKWLCGQCGHGWGEVNFGRPSG